MGHGGLELPAWFTWAVPHAPINVSGANTVWHCWPCPSGGNTMLGVTRRSRKAFGLSQGSYPADPTMTASHRLGTLRRAGHGGDGIAERLARSFARPVPFVVGCRPAVCEKPCAFAPAMSRPAWRGGHGRRTLTALTRVAAGHGTSTAVPAPHAPWLAAAVGIATVIGFGLRRSRKPISAAAREGVPWETSIAVSAAGFPWDTPLPDYPANAARNAATAASSLSRGMSTKSSPHRMRTSPGRAVTFMP